MIDLQIDAPSLTRRGRAGFKSISIHYFGDFESELKLELEFISFCSVNCFYN